MDTNTVDKSNNEVDTPRNNLTNDICDNATGIWMISEDSGFS